MSGEIVGTSMGYAASIVSMDKRINLSSLSCFFLCNSKQTFLERVLIVLLFCKTILVVFRMGVKLGLTLRDGYILWVFENRVLRRIYGSKRDEVTGECKYITRRGA